jgi:hypothetical protein
MFFRMLAYRRDARSNQPARKVRQTPFDGFFGVKFDILKPRWLLTTSLRDDSSTASRTGDPTTGDFHDAVILARFGEVDLDSLGE